MKRPIYTPAEYRQLGQQFTGFMYYCCQVRCLVSLAYPFKSPLFKTIAEAHDKGIRVFKNNLEELAYTEHREESFADDFDPARNESYQPPTTLPGCSAEETALLISAKERRWQEKKRKLLNVDELNVVVKFLYHVDTVCWEIVNKTNAFDKTSPPTAQALFSPSLTIGKAFDTVSREIQRVRDEQA